MPEVVAIVVARGGSTRVPRKALRPFARTTLIGHKVEQLRQCSLIDRVVVGSDDDAILAAGAEAGAATVRRDAYHCDESRCSANDMLADMAGKVEGDIVVWAHPTNPLCGPLIYGDAIRQYLDRDPAQFDSLCSVTTVRRHAWRESKCGTMPANFNPWMGRHPLAKELPAYHFQNGAIFIQSRDQMLANRYFYGRAPILFPIEAPYDHDIDTEHDLMLAHLLHEHLQAEAVR